MKIKPSSFRDAIFLPGALGKAELEFAVVFIVRYLQANGDEWRPVEARAMGLFIQSKLASCKSLSERDLIFRNPFALPDFGALAEAGFAELSEDRSTITLTDECIEKCARSVGLLPKERNP